MKLKNRVALITGGGSGIGEATAHALAGEGAHVVLAGRRQAAIDRVAQEVARAHGTRTLAVSTDVGDEAQVQRLLAGTLDAFQRIDVLVNNAGISGRGGGLDTSTAQWDRVMAVNLRGPFLCTRAVLPTMLGQAARGDEPPGIIVNVSSEAGKFGYGNSLAYTTSKWGLMGFTHSLEAELLESGIKVVAICPGMVVTEMTEREDERVKSRSLRAADVAELIRWICTAPPNVRITEVMIRTMLNPWA